MSHGSSLCEGFAGPLGDVVSPALISAWRLFDCLRLFPVISLWLGRPVSYVPIPFQFSPLYSCQDIFTRSCMLDDGFQHMLVSGLVFVGDVKELSEAYKL